nr:cell cycle control protein 50C isoform X6 [Equus caballus]XP_023479691.1 cell cycle control protein 50C isoform X6 [Equus caballus]
MPGISTKSAPALSPFTLHRQCGSWLIPTSVRPALAILCHATTCLLTHPALLILVTCWNFSFSMGNVYMYYKLYGFYQNLHGYLLSRSNSQLLGTDVKDVETCAPFSKSHDGTPIAPCGAIANSLFNDTIILSYKLNSSVHIQVPMLRSGITWWTDKYIKFRNPSSSNLSSAFAGTTKPPSWPKPVYELDENDPGNNGFLNDDFIVWMRTAAFPTFKKLYRRLSRTQHFIEGLPAGNYSFNVSYNFPVTRFQGEKSVVLSTLTWSGGHSLFLGLAYTVTGAMTWLAAFSMMAVHLKLKGKRFSPDDKVKL